MTTFIPVIILTEKRKIVGKTKKGNNVYKCINMLNNEVYHIGLHKHYSINIYAIALSTPGNIRCNLEMILGSDLEALERALFYKYNINIPKPPVIIINENIDILTDLHNPISIDPSGCTDIDDAFAYDAEYLYVYITDISKYVSLTDLLALRQFVTIYGINIFHMMPANIIKKCSLFQYKIKSVVRVQFKLSNASYVYIGHTREIVKMGKNYTYDNIPKSKYDTLCTLLNLPSDTHLLIEKLMIMTNMAIGHIFKECKTKAFFKTQKLVSDYSLYDYDIAADHYHATLNIYNYAHFTSPLRRLIDCYNHLLLFNPDLVMNVNIDKHNEQLISIKKLQLQLNTLKLSKIIYDNDCYIITKIKLLDYNRVLFIEYDTIIWHKFDEELIINTIYDVEASTVEKNKFKIYILIMNLIL